MNTTPVNERRDNKSPERTVENLASRNMNLKKHPSMTLQRLLSVSVDKNRSHP